MIIDLAIAVRLVRRLGRVFGLAGVDVNDGCAGREDLSRSIGLFLGCKPASPGSRSSDARPSQPR